MHSILDREGDETSMLVECHGQWAVIAVTFQLPDVTAFWCQNMEPTVSVLGNDDLALIGDAHTANFFKVATVVVGELEHG